MKQELQKLGVIYTSESLKLSKKLSSQIKRGSRKKWDNRQQYDCQDERQLRCEPIKDRTVTVMRLHIWSKSTVLRTPGACVKGGERTDTDQESL